MPINRDSVWRQLDATIYIVHATGELMRGRVEFVSGGTFRLLGYDPEDFQTNPDLWNQSLHPEDVPRVIAQTLEIFQKGLPQHRIYRMRHKTTGKYHWIEDSTVPLKDATGTIEGLAGVARDVTHLKQLEEELEGRDAKPHVHLPLDEMPDGMLVVDRHGRIIEANAAVERILGWTSQDLQGRPVEQLLPERYRDLHIGSRVAYAKAPHIRRMGALDLMALHRDGHEVPVDIMLGPLPAMDAPRFLAIVRDMTDVRAAQRQVALLSALVQSSDDSIFATNTEGELISWNRGAERLFGYSEQEILGRHFGLLFPDHLREKGMGLSQNVRGGSHPLRFESRLVRKDGTEFDGSAILSLIQDRDGTVMGVSSICRDVTERNRINEDLKTARRAAELASQAKSEFLANMSHELRTPLNAVLGLTEAVLDSELNDEQRGHLMAVRDAGELLLSAVKDILDITKLQSGKYLVQPRDFSPREFVEDALRPFVEAAQQKQLRLSWSVRPEVPELLRGDPDCLRQVLSNLVDNAIKYTPRGSVDVEMAWREDAEACFEVRDTGIGIPTDKQRQIFEPFSQSDNSTRRGFGGAGLGLAICAALADVLGGAISMESNAESGSTFRFRVPLELPRN